MAIEVFYNYEAEVSVLGSIFMEPSLIHDLIIEPDHFYDPKHVKLYKWMKALQKNEEIIDLVTIVEIAGERIKEVGGVSHVSEMIMSVPTTANIKYYERIVIDKWKKRETYKAYQEAMQAIEEEDGDVKLRKKVDEINDTARIRKKFSMKEHLLNKYQKMEEQADGLAGASTGLHDLDHMIEGLRKKKLIIVPARPSMGKTAFSIDICKGAVLKSLGQDEEVFANIFSLEMGENELTDRMLASSGNIDGKKLKNPKMYFNDSDWGKYSGALQELSSFEENMDICDDSTITVAEIRSRVKENMKEHPDKHHIIMIDYLQLIRASGMYAGNRTQEISEISRDLKNMANDLDVTVIALSQLSRGVEQRQDKRPMLSDIRESGSIEQDADIVLFLYRDDYYDAESENKNIVEIIIAKNRDGSIGTVSFAFLKEYSKFVNLERRFN